MASQTSHERSCCRITAIRPTIPAGSPHNSIKMPKEGSTTWLDGVNTVADMINAGTMIERTTYAAASPTDHHQSRVLGHLRMRRLNG